MQDQAEKKAKQDQEEISLNHVQRLFLGSVCMQREVMLHRRSMEGICAGIIVSIGFEKWGTASLLFFGY